jgi:membrane protease YdiL (CAAX protease family)
VLPGSPADEAGIEPGDRVVAVDGQPVTTRDALASGLSLERGVPITVERDGTTRELEVRARETLESPPVLPSETCAPMSAPRESPWALAPYGLVLLLVLALWLRGRTRGVRQWTFWLPFGAVLFTSSLVGTLGQYAGCAAFGGPGLRAMAASLFLSEVFLVSVAMGWLFLVRRRGVPRLALDDGAPWSIPRTYGTGLFYAMAWLPRIAMISVPLLWAAQRLEVLEVSPMLEDVLGAAGTDPISAVLVALAAAVLAPLAEEALFRGVLLPHLGRALAAWPAIITSAVVFGLLHVSHGVMLLGPLVLGVVMGWARVRSGGLVAPILLHVSFNAVAVLSSWLR